MVATNRSMNDSAEDRRIKFAKCVTVLTRWFEKWKEAFPTHAVTKLQIAVYVEALDDLTPEHIDIGCREATRTAEQFPKPGHIRKAFERKLGGEYYLGPRAIKYPEIGPGEREQAAIEYSAKLKETLKTISLPLPIKQLKVLPPPRPIEEQKDELRRRGLL